MSNTVALSKKTIISLVLSVTAIAVALTAAIYAQYSLNSSMTSIRESSSSIDASLVASSLMLARSENGVYPASVETDEHRTLLFDGKPVFDRSGELITLLEDKTILDYRAGDEGFTFCVVDSHGPWASADYSREDFIVSGAEDQACTV